MPHKLAEPSDATQGGKSMEDIEDILTALRTSNNEIAVVVYKNGDGTLVYQLIYPPGAVNLIERIEQQDPNLKSAVESEVNKRLTSLSTHGTVVDVATIIQFADVVSQRTFLKTQPQPIAGEDEFLAAVGAQVAKTALFTYTLRDPSQLGWEGMGEVDTAINQWNKEYLAEESAANTAKNLSLFGSGACVSLIFILLDTTFLRDTAADVDKTVYESLKKDSPERQQYYDKLARLQDADITSTSRILLLMFGVTAYMLLWSETIAQARFKFAANAIVKTRPIVLPMTQTSPSS